MITNLGRACGRVRRNIEHYSPTAIIYFHQKDPGWNETNEAYRKALSKFNTHPKIQEYSQKRRLIPEEVSSITDYIDFFDKLADLVEKTRTSMRLYILTALVCPNLPQLSLYTWQVCMAMCIQYITKTKSQPDLKSQETRSILVTKVRVLNRFHLLGPTLIG